MSHADSLFPQVEPYVEGLLGPLRDQLTQTEGRLAAALTDLETCAATNTSLNQALRGANTEVGRLTAELRAALERIAELEQPPEPKVWPLHVHTIEGPASYWDAVEVRQDYGRGAFVYQSNFGMGALKHNTFWAQRYDRGPLPIVVSPMVEADPAALREWCERMPDAQRPLMVVAPRQEPEDDILFTKSLTVEQYRRIVTSHALVREYGIRLAAEVQEFAIAPGNTWGSNADWLTALLEGLPLDEVHWSLYEYNAKPGRVRVERIAAFMKRLNLPWEASAIGITVPLNATTEQRQARAANVVDTFRALREHGAGGGGWFDVRGFAGKDRDNDTRTDPLLLQALTTAKE